MRAVTTWSLAGGIGMLAIVLLLTGKSAETQVPGPVPIPERVSVRVDGLQANSNSTGPVVSGDAECVAFYSDATNLLPQGGGDVDTNNVRDVYLVNRQTHTLERVSLTSTGGQSNGPSQLQGFRPAIDENCTCVAFSSDATNLVSDDTNNRTDVFVRDLGAATTIRASVGDGEQSNGASSFPSVSADCQLIAFQSSATNLVDGDANEVSDIFVFNRGTGLTTRVSVGASGEGNGASITPAISSDGRCIAFASAADNLLPGDTNGTPDIYVACDGHITCRASVDSNGAEANDISFLPALSADGRIVAFKSNASNLVSDDRNRAADVFVHDCQSGATERVSIGDIGQEGDDIAIPPSISEDGRFVAFGSYASNLLLGRSTGGRSQVYVRDRELGTTLLVSTDANGNPGNNSIPDLPPSISGDGMFVSFASLASNLVPGDTNQALDVFVRQNVTATPTPSASPTGTNTPRPSGTPTPRIPCHFDTDCPLGQVCQDDVCVPAPTVTPTIACTNDDDCPGDLKCVNGVCRDLSTPTPTPTPLPTCMMDSDCPDPNTHCRAMVCVPKRECDDEDPEVDRVNCRGVRETCLNGLCECGGDCNLDGIVFGTELTKMVCIVMNDCQLATTCPAGDFDGNGEIMGTELTMALRNLSLGCPGEGAPLIFAHDRTGEERSVEVEDNDVIPGQFVDVDFAVGGGGEVTTAQLDVLLPTNVIDIDTTNPVADCTIAGRLANSHRLDASFPQRPVTAAGNVRLRFVVWDDELRRSFSDGPIATCRFHIKNNVAQGDYNLGFDTNRLEIGDTNGDKFGATVTGGRLTVGQQMCGDGKPPCPEGTECIDGFCKPPPTGCTDSSECLDRQACVEGECVCGGDCNGDGQVLPNEVVTSIQIFGGTVDLATCPAADVDGNQSVLPNDVITAIQNFGLNCPQ